MQHPCMICGILIQTGERFSGEFTGIYRQVKSAIMFAVRPTDLEYVPGTLRHVKCEKELQ